MTSIWAMLVVVALAGFAGGCVNAFMSDNGFMLPKAVGQDGGTILRPGAIGNALIGAVAAVVSWGMYGPLAAVAVISGSSAAADPASTGGLTLSAIAGAILTGIGGARWLTNEVDKKLLRSAAATATSAAIANAAPAADATPEAKAAVGTQLKAYAKIATLPPAAVLDQANALIK